MSGLSERDLHATVGAINSIISSILKLQRAVLDIAASLPDDRHSVVMGNVDASLDELSKAVKRMAAIDG